MVELVRGLSGSNLPYGGCYWFEFAYPQLMNLVEAKLYDITQFFQYNSLINDLSFLYRNSVLRSQICYGTRSSILECVCGERERERERERKQVVDWLEFQSYRKRSQSIYLYSVYVSACMSERVINDH